MIPLQHIAADSAAAKLQADHAAMKIMVDARTNTIIVAGSNAEVDAICQAVRRIDQPG